MSQSHYDAARVVANLTAEMSLSRFGLLIQALFAHVLVRLGANVLEIRTPGHPDISAVLAGNLHKIEVEAASRKTHVRRLDPGDLEVLQVKGERELGFFCVLDCGPPIAWLCVDIARLGNRVNDALRMSLLRAYADQGYSRDCTDQFADMVIKQGNNLLNLSYARLCQEALAGINR